MSLTIRSALAVLFATIAVANEASAGIIVNPPQPITKHIQVQLIQTALDNGAAPATVFGNAAQQAAISSRINTIWAQAGMDVTFLPSITHWNNTFAYHGNAGSGTRPQSDLNFILPNALAAGVLNSDPQVIDMFMVSVVPAFPPLDQNTAAGLSYVDGNGVTGYVGGNLLTFSNGLDVIAGTFAHEIGHNLGLQHTATGGPNLMSPNSTTYQLDASQIATARASLYARAYTAPILGDYSGDGIVDAVDYVLWRETLNQTGTGLLADGNANGRIDAGDYTVWRSRFGGSLFGAGTSVGDGSVPEPSAVTFLVLFLLPLARRAKV